jgi:hypothetical protein
VSCSELLTRYYSFDQVKKNEMGETFGMYGREERGMQGFGRGSGGKTALGRSRHRYVENNKIDLQEGG